MNIVIDKDTSLYLFFNNQYRVINHRDKRIDSTFSYRDDTVNVKHILASYSPIVIKNRIYFIEEEGGGVYEFKERKFDRIDFSFTHKMQVASTIFIHSDTIFRYGGYGFFSSRDFFTYFDFKIREWEAYAPINSDKIPVGSSDNFKTISNNTICLFGGKFNNSKWRKEFVPMKEVWEFNFLDHQWTNLGAIDVNQLSIHPIQFKDKLAMVYRLSLEVIDNKNNKISFYKGNSYISRLKFAPIPLYFDGKFYFVSALGESNQDDLCELPESEFLGDFTADKKFYRNNSAYLWILYTLIFLGLVAVMFYWKSYFQLRNKRLKLLMIKGNHIHYQNKRVEFDPLSIKVIMVLLIARDKGVSGTELLVITERKDLHNSHNIRERNNLLNVINFRIKTLLETEEDIITSEKSEHDQRVKIYMLRHELFLQD